MKMIAPSKLETALLPPFKALPLAHIQVPDTAAQFAAAVAAIHAAGVVGFDTESKPTFAVGEASQGPHVLQFALDHQVFIFQIHRPGCLDAVVDLLRAPGVQKVGFGLQSDRGQIHNRFGVVPQGVLDLTSIFHRLGYRNAVGVRAAVGIVFQQRFAKSKKTTTSNWALPHLSPGQLLYAANDAYAALKVWQVLQHDAALQDGAAPMPGAVPGTSPGPSPG